MVSFEAFQADFEQRRQTNGLPERQVYAQHFFVVKEAIDQCLQCAVRFDHIASPAEAVDLVRSQAGPVELVDVTALETLSGNQPDYLTTVSADGPSIARKAYASQPPQRFHDEHKFNDMLLVFALAHKGPPTQADSEIVYLHHTSLLAAYGLWYRLKLPVPEEAVYIITTLHSPTSRYGGCDWAEIERRIETNAPQNPLWYNREQEELLTKMVQHIRQLEKRESYQKVSRDGNPEIRRQAETSFLGRLLGMNKKDK